MRLKIDLKVIKLHQEMQKTMKYWKVELIEAKSYRNCKTFGIPKMV